MADTYPAPDGSARCVTGGEWLNRATFQTSHNICFAKYPLRSFVLNTRVLYVARMQTNDLESFLNHIRIPHLAERGTARRTICI